MPEKMRALWKGKLNERVTEVKDADGEVIDKIVEYEPEGFLPGVPARSLTQDDYTALSEEQQKAVHDSPLYELRTDTEMSTAGDRGSAPSPAPVEVKKES